MEHWAEIRRLHLSEGMSVKAITRRLGVARNTVRSALAAAEPPKYARPVRGSGVDAFDPAIRLLLKEFPDMPATVIAERVGFTGASSVLRARVAVLRPLFRPSDPADRTSYAAGVIVQCDLWFPAAVVPVGAGQWLAPPVLTMACGYSRWIMAMALPTRTTPDLLAGMWTLLAGLGGVPKTLVWDNEAGIGQHQRLTVGARAFAETLGTRIWQAPARDPETKGVVERANGFLQTSFMPGRSFTSGEDFNGQLAGWLPRANDRLVRATGATPASLVAADVAAMGALPPVGPRVAWTARLRLGRDYYVRVLGNDYSVDPLAIGRVIEVTADLERVQARCAGQLVADHPRCWARAQTLTDAAHVVAAKVLRTAFQTRARDSGPAQSGARPHGPGHVVATRALSDYDTLFGLATPATTTTPVTTTPATTPASALEDRTGAAAMGAAISVLRAARMISAGEARHDVTQGRQR